MRTPQADLRGFRRGGALVDSLEAGAASRLLAAAGDITLLLDCEGVIRDIAVGAEDLAESARVDSWLDRPLADTVTTDSRGKIAEMLAEAGSGAPRWRQVNHMLQPDAASADPARRQVPVRYFAISAGAGGEMVAIGRDMRAEARLQQRLLAAQQSMERDYMRLRQAEARYRLLFDVSREAVLIVDMVSRRITDANPSALALVGGREATIVGQPLAAVFVPDDRPAALALMGAAGQAAEAPEAELRVGPEGRPVRVAVSLFRHDGAMHGLVCLSPQAAAPEPCGDQTALLAVVERIPDAFVLTDASLRILSVNGAFLDLAEAAAAEQVIGQPLDSWLGRPGIDLNLLLTQLREHGSVRNFATLLRGRLGAEEDVEVSAVAVESGGQSYHGFTIRRRARSLLEAPAEDAAMPRSVEQLTELVGRVSLKEIVRESTDLIERLCIEAALNFTSNNRASAAEMLGLSRQSLYSKLRRHGLGNLAVDFD